MLFFVFVSAMIDLSPQSAEFYWMDENISKTEPARYNLIFFEKVSNKYFIEVPTCGIVLLLESLSVKYLAQNAVLTIESRSIACTTTFYLSNLQ